VKHFRKQVAGDRWVLVKSLFLSPIPRHPSPVLLFVFLFPLFSFLFAYAVTYRVDPAGGPETLAAEVKEAFAAWVALSNKIEVDETQENPEGIFQYGAAERFGSDTLSLTVQRQADTRSILYLINPNTDNRKRILLHETGIAIGLTPQIPGTPAPPATTPTDTNSAPDGATPAPETGTETTPKFETTPAPGTPTDSESNTTSSDTEDSSSPDSTSSDTDTASSDSATTENTTEDTAEQTTTEQTTTEQTTTEQTTAPQPSEEPSTESSAPTAESSEPAPTLTENSVMNPSISPDDSVELGNVERQLVEQLQLFVSEDINRDGAVNFYDLVALSQAFGRSGVNDPADITKDGVIDQSDVDALRQSYTFSDPSQTAPDAVSTTPTDDVPTDTSPPPNAPLPGSTQSDDSDDSGE
jgi:hypothetical protein